MASDYAIINQVDGFLYQVTEKNLQFIELSSIYSILKAFNDAERSGKNIVHERAKRPFVPDKSGLRNR
jgi:hypothetical protein